MDNHRASEAALSDDGKRGGEVRGSMLPRPSGVVEAAPSADGPDPAAPTTSEIEGQAALSAAVAPVALTAGFADAAGADAATAAVPLPSLRAMDMDAAGEGEVPPPIMEPPQSLLDPGAPAAPAPPMEAVHVAMEYLFGLLQDMVPAQQAPAPGPAQPAEDLLLPAGDTSGSDTCSVCGVVGIGGMRSQVNGNGLLCCGVTCREAGIRQAVKVDLEKPGPVDRPVPSSATLAAFIGQLPSLMADQIHVIVHGIPTMFPLVEFNKLRTKLNITCDAQHTQITRCIFDHPARLDPETGKWTYLTKAELAMPVIAEQKLLLTSSPDGCPEMKGSFATNARFFTVKELLGIVAEYEEDHRHFRYTNGWTHHLAGPNIYFQGLQPYGYYQHVRMRAKGFAGPAWDADGKDYFGNMGETPSGKVVHFEQIHVPMFASPGPLEIDILGVLLHAEFQFHVVPL